jgi:hypothetical protein
MEDLRSIAFFHCYQTFWVRSALFPKCCIRHTNIDAWGKGEGLWRELKYMTEGMNKKVTDFI